MNEFNDDFCRDKSIPMWFFMRQVTWAKSKINYISKTHPNRYSYKNVRNSDLAFETLSRFFSIYKIPAYRAFKYIHKAELRYRTRSDEFDKEIFYLYRCIGFVSVNKNPLNPVRFTAIRAKEVSIKRDKLLTEKIKNKYSNIDLDIFVLSKEVEFLSKLNKYKLNEIRTQNG